MLKFRVMQMHTVLGKVSLNIVIWSHPVLIGVVEGEQLENSRLQKVERSLSNEQAKKEETMKCKKMANL